MPTVSYKFNNFTVFISPERDKLLTTIGKGVLDDGYLIKRETYQQAFARAACTYADNEQHAQRLYDYASQHYFMFATPVLANAGNPRGLPVSCLTKDMIINTKYGAKRIKDIKEGDLVLTHKGRWKPVQKILSKMNDEPIYELQVNGRTTKIEITGNHPILTNSGWKRIDTLNIDEDWVAANNKIEYLEKGYTIDLLPFCKHEMEEKEGLLSPINKSISSFTPVKRFVTMDENLAKFMGWWFAEGSLSMNAAGEANGIRFTLDTKEREVATWLLGVAKEKFNVNGNIYFSETEKGNSWLSVNVNSQVVGNFFKSFGKGCKEKELPSWVFDLPKSELECLYEGMLLGDGCLIRDNGTVTITLANYKLLCGLYNIGLKLGKEVTLKLDTKPGKLATVEKVYTLGVLGQEGERRRITSRGVTFEGNSYRPILSLTKTNKKEKVYDIQVEEDESFSVAGVVVHNCFLQYVDDSCEGLIDTMCEAAWLSVRGGGIAAYYGDVRSIGEVTSHGNETPGVVPFIKDYDSIVGSFKQGKTRRGAGAVYMDVSHPEIIEFLNFRREDRAPDHNRFMSFIHHGINITDAFMEAVTKGNDWPLIDPHSKKIKKKLDARSLWKEILTTRLATGEPYLHFVDTANRYLPDALKLKGLKIHGSNLCSEIELPTGPDRSAVCCLSSINLEKYEDWKNEPLFVEDLIRMLDNVIEDFIKRAPTAMHKAVKSAMAERSVGLGAMGWHYLLQSKGIPFESVMAIGYLKKIHAIIWHEANAATAKLAEEKGEAYDMIGTGKRNAHLIAIAPNANSADVCGETSPGIEPMMSNIFEKSNKSGDYLIQNRYLQKRLKELGKDTLDVWQNINVHGGSVQHLDFLTENDKLVFKTAMEIDQMWIIQQAGERQKYIDQGQSINLFYDPNSPSFDMVDVVKTHKAAWMLGLKALYYIRTKSAGQVDSLGTGEITLDNSIDKVDEKVYEKDSNECLACSG